MVVCLDNLFSWWKENIKDLFCNPNFTFIFHDIINPFWWQFHQIYNLACPASPVSYQRKPVETIKTSVLWSINMLDLALKLNARILQASTSEVYGCPLIHPQSESYWGNVNPIGLRSCYDEWKRCAESLFMDYHRQYGVDVRIIRIFNTYWPNMLVHDGRVISNFVIQALKWEDITIYGDGSQTRSFQYIDDLIEGIIAMMNHVEWNSWPINLWSDEEINMKNLAKTILKLIPESKSKIIFQPLPSDDPKQRKANSQLAKNLFWRETTIDLEHWLKKTIEYFRPLVHDW